MARYRLMTKDELIEKFGSISNIDWVPDMDQYFGTEVEWNGESSSFRIGYWLYKKEWLVLLDKKTKPTKQSNQTTKLKLIENVIIKLDQNK